MNSTKSGLLAIAASGLLLLMAGGGVVYGIYRTDGLADRQQEISDQLFRARQLYEMILDMESSQRGFLLTRDPSYLEPYNRASGSVAETVAGFDDRVHAGPDVQAAILEIRQFAAAKAGELAETITFARAGRWDEAVAIVKENRGQHDMQAFRARLLPLVAQYRMERSTLDYQERRTFLQLFLLGGGAAALILILVIVVIRVLTTSIRELDLARLAAQRNAMHDALTGLPNRRYLSEWLRTALAGAQRAARELYVIYFDLDGFKAVNDRFGHEAGDRVLQATATRLRDALRAADFVARMGGDEFVAVLPNGPPPVAVDAIVDRIREQLALSPIPELQDGEVSASIGKALFPRDGDTPEELLAAADSAMFEVKQERRASLGMHRLRPR